MSIFLRRYSDLGHDFKTADIKPALRLNTLKISKDDFVVRMKDKGVKLKKIPYTDNGYWFSSEFSLSSTPEYLMGYLYIQEAASQLPVKVLAPSKDDIVLDMCAAPGSKTTQLAQSMDNSGKIIALETNFERIKALLNNLERCGVSNCIVFQKDALYCNDLGIKFNRVLLDAPCSGNLAVDKDWLEKRTIEGIQAQAVIQKKLIAKAISSLAKDGVLVYSTCSLEPEEDEQVIEYALDNFPVVLEKTGLDFGQPGITKRTALCKRFWPDTEKTQGFFIAKLVKK
jgi:NOL1/NOP2/sun family putative RNA methylase